jgi:hypothetical protein
VNKKKTKKIASAFEKKQTFVSKNHEKTRFSSTFWFFKLRALVEQKLFAIMEGNFSALRVKRIQEKSKNDPPYCLVLLVNLCMVFWVFEYLARNQISLDLNQCSHHHQFCEYSKEFKLLNAMFDELFPGFKNVFAFSFIHKNQYFLHHRCSHHYQCCLQS